MLKCKHRHIGNDQKPRCYHDEKMGKFICSDTGTNENPQGCPKTKELPNGKLSVHTIHEI
jgi:hypothetical protein